MPAASTADVASCSIAQLQAILDYWDERQTPEQADLECSELPKHNRYVPTDQNGLGTPVDGCVVTPGVVRTMLTLRLQHQHLGR